jgi:hypothetical protein
MSRTPIAFSSGNGTNAATAKMPVSQAGRHMDDRSGSIPLGSHVFGSPCYR